VLLWVAPGSFAANGCVRSIQLILFEEQSKSNLISASRYGINSTACTLQKKQAQVEGPSQYRINPTACTVQKKHTTEEGIGVKQNNS